MKDKLWRGKAWEEYLCWSAGRDTKTFKKINELIKDIDRNGYKGIGKPEPLKHDWAGYWSREIDKKNRIIYKIENGLIIIAQCGSHYGDK